MCKRSCMVPSESCAGRSAEDRRPEVCSCGNPADAGAGAVETKKSWTADEAEGAAAGEQAPPPAVTRRPAAGEDSARERLKRHRMEMAGRVRIPEMWGQERLLKDWVDCAVFDRPLAATRGLLNARDALVAECADARRPLLLQNSCS
ncbi:hypothetical protein GUJ93_ZPchr0006g43818 [Zizania palustris]|uniref:Protein BIC1 n=1 Tax=Zizania palustris TaxID=103762 RepID=A0A8J5SY41_ZIZPA|nr:hypothetical protein GUJ93_ZPchr0006g43818 [Zizania palustris]